MKKIGIYGGSFSPPHYGHIGAAKAFRDELSLDQLLIMPANIPPHKITSAAYAAEHRFNMAKLAFSPLDKTEVSDFELSRQEVSYTANTLTHFAKDGKLYFLCGTDMFLTLAKWYRPDIIFEKAVIVLASRDTAFDHEVNAAWQSYQRDYHAEIIQLNNPIVKLSSTEVRKALQEGRDVSAYIPKSVEDYIHEHHLAD